MKNIYKLTLLATFVFIIAACKKEALLDGSRSIERSSALEKQFKTTLNDSKDGWILFVTTLNPDVKTATPIILKFDTVTNIVTTTSMYGNNASNTYFNISAGTGMPLFSFATGSTFSGIYEVGGTNITDYFFKVLKIGTDTVELQNYRKGSSNQSEGGAIIKMVRNNNPSWIREWQQETNKLISQTRFFGFYLTARMTYASGEVFAPATIAFLNQSAGNITFLKSNYPTITNNSQVDAFTPAYFPTGSRIDPLGFLGYNSIFYEVSTAFTPASLFSTGPAALQKLFKTNYFLIRKINATSIDVFALDKDGKEIITGTITLQ